MMLNLLGLPDCSAALGLQKTEYVLARSACTVTVEYKICDTSQGLHYVT